MIIIRTPLRVSLVGGGTDISQYYSLFGGNFLNFSINKYIYMTAHPLVESKSILLKYSNYEKVLYPNEIKHPVFKEVLSSYSVRGIDISVSSDIPAGTGLGSSSSFTVGLIHLIRKYLNLSVGKIQLAEEACKVEIDDLREPIGVQDQYAAAMGGLNYYSIKKSGQVNFKNLNHIEPLYGILNQNSILVRIPGTRSASSLLIKQENNRMNQVSMSKIQEIAIKFFDNLPKTAEELGGTLHKTWEIKKTLSRGVSTSAIDLAYEHMVSLGAYGGKLLGAGGAGYLFMVGSHDFINKIKQSNEFSSIIPTIDLEGTKIIYESK